MLQIHSYLFRILLALFMMLPLLTLAQSKPQITIKQGDTLRLKSDGRHFVDTTITIIVPMDRDSSQNKKNFIIQDSLKSGTITVELDKDRTTTDLSRTSLAIRNEFKIDSLKKENRFQYNLHIPRHPLDDRIVTLNIVAKDAKGKLVNQAKKRITVYVKPLGSDSISASDNMELWFHAGTNFDLFDGAKPQEFFFRGNMFFKVAPKLYAQMAFYKNRYFIDGNGNEEERAFNVVKNPTLYGDTLYTMLNGTYKHSSTQTTDALAWQFDFLYKLTDDKNSNFFVSGGWDISTTSVTLNNTYKFLDTIKTLRTSRPDTVRNFQSFVGTTSFPESLKYRQPAYNYNLGLMWIFNDDVLNIKTHLVAGVSAYSELSSRTRTPTGDKYTFNGDRSLYIQTRVMATYKPLGISFGMEAFIRQKQIPAFNFTLSKAFDLKKLVSNLSPVSSLKL